MSEENLEKNENDEAGFGFHIIVFLLTLPLGMIIGRWMPEMILPIGDGFSLHGIISMICAYFLLSNLLYPLRGIINLIGIVGLSIVLFMFWNGNLKKDEIKSLFYTSVGTITQHKIAGRSIDHEPEIIKAIEDDNELDGFVKSYGNKYINSNLLDESILRSFSIFNKISNPNWKYINDPKNRELFRPVSETIKTNSGDCDDYAICLAACMKHCGACARIVHADGHLYPQVYVGQLKDKEKVTLAIRKLFPSARNHIIHFTEEEDKLWLNMDYTANHPGGEFISNFNFEKLELCD